MATSTETVTIYCLTMYGTGIGRCEGGLIEHGTKPPKSIDSGPFVIFMPPGKRKPRTLIAREKPYLVILRGTGYPNPPAPFKSRQPSQYINSFSTPGGDAEFDKVFAFDEDEWAAFDPRYETAFDKFIDAYADRFIADYRLKEEPPSSAAPPAPNPTTGAQRGEPDEDQAFDDELATIFDPTTLEDKRRKAPRDKGPASWTGRVPSRSHAGIQRAVRHHGLQFA